MEERFLLKMYFSFIPALLADYIAHEQNSSLRAFKLSCGRRMKSGNDVLSGDGGHSEFCLDC